MKRYRYKEDATSLKRFLVEGSPVKGEVYEESYTWGTRMYNVGELAKINPDGWELIEDFVLPDRWCVKGSSKELLDYCNKFGKHKGNYIDVSSWYCHFPQYADNDRYSIICSGTTSSTIEDGYTEITEEQFLKYVIMKNEEIIGYKLKDEYISNEEVQAAALAIEGGIVFGTKTIHSRIAMDFKAMPVSIESAEKLRKVKVLDLWFEPVYKPKLTLPTINGYDGKVDGNNVKYGCANFNIERLNILVNIENLSGCRDIKSITLSSGVTVTMEEIKQIVEYCNN